MSVSPEAVLARLEGWENAVLSELDGGYTNHTWLVEANGRKAVLKIDPAPRGEPFNTRRQEASIQNLAAASRLASRVLYVDETTYMTEYLEGRICSVADFDNDDTLSDLAQALRRMHELPLTGRRFNALGAARQYAAHIATIDEERVRKHLNVIESMPEPSRLCCCHNDLVAENIVIAPEIRFIDWEYACDNDPMFDLATIVGHHALSDARALLLLDAYFDGGGVGREEQLAEYVAIYNALLCLWQEARKSPLSLSG
ncbi:MAG: phosphotransferase [Woeseiaceae bacterium]|nr:phosphotransferase [Woeseiaceae bacterium]